MNEIELLKNEKHYYTMKYHWIKYWYVRRSHQLSVTQIKTLVEFITPSENWSMFHSVECTSSRHHGQTGTDPSNKQVLHKVTK